MGYDQELGLGGGIVYRSFDQGSSWSDDTILAKRGNIRLIDRGDGSVDAFLTRTSVGQRTDHYRNYDVTKLS